MKIVQTEGLALLGPGSESIWLALTCVVLIFTVIAIFLQLRLQSSAAAIETLSSLQHEWYSERITHSKLAVLVALEPGSRDRAQIPTAPAEMLLAFWDRVGILARGGHVDRKLLWKGLGVPCQYWWATLAPYVGKVQSDEHDRKYWNDFEWLAEGMAKISQREKVWSTYDENNLERARPGYITAYRDILEAERTLRTVTVASPLSGRAEPSPAAPI